MKNVLLVAYFKKSPQMRLIVQRKKIGHYGFTIIALKYIREDAPTVSKQYLK